MYYKKKYQSPTRNTNEWSLFLFAKKGKNYELIENYYILDYHLVCWSTRYRLLSIKTHVLCKW